MDESDTAQGNGQESIDNRQEPMRRLMKDSRGWQGKIVGKFLHYQHGHIDAL